MSISTTTVVTALLALAGPAQASNPVDGFTACMRVHGLPEFPAGTVTEDGRVQLDPGRGDIDPFSAAYRAATAECADELPPGVALPADPPPPQPPPAVSLLPSPPAPPQPPRF